MLVLGVDDDGVAADSPSLTPVRIYIVRIDSATVRIPGGKIKHSTEPALSQSHPKSNRLASTLISAYASDTLQRLPSNIHKWLTDVSLYVPVASTLILIHSVVNEARALRVVELMNDFRTIHLHISSHTSRAQAYAPDQQSYYADGYVVLRQCSEEGQAMLSTNFSPSSLDLSGGTGASEVQKAALQRWDCFMNPSA
jgi:hypothetical protein